MSIQSKQDRHHFMEGIGELGGFSGLALAGLMLCAVALARVLGNRTRSSELDMAPGEQRIGPYVLLELIGEGATGKVYRARHAVLGRLAAIKVLSGRSADDHERFEREARLMATIRDPGTPSVYDFGRCEDGAAYYVMELVEGITLAELVEREGPQTPERTVRIVTQICAALGKIHDAGFVHGDIKHDNIVFFRRGANEGVKVLDFGLARSIGATEEADTADVVVGTPHYMPPEAMLTPRGADTRSDLYAVGGLSYYLLAARPPFTGDTLVEVLSRQLYAEPEPFRRTTCRAVPPELERIVLDCLAKDPDARPRSAGAVIERLQKRREGSAGCRSGRRPIDVWA